MQQVTAQPEMMVLNKYFGFLQLEYLKENNIDCVMAHEFFDHNNDQIYFMDSKKLWSVRIATMTGRDFYLPSIVGATNSQAIAWIKTQQSIDNRYIFMCSEYFESTICGRMHIDKNKTSIEAFQGDFIDCNSKIPDLSISRTFKFAFTEDVNNKKIPFLKKIQLIELSKNLKELYQEELDENDKLVYEFDFSFCRDYEEQTEETKLKIIGMRSYILNNFVFHQRWHF